MQINTIAVVGSGTMGRGIAEVCAGAGFNVVLFDAAPGASEAAMTSFKKNAERAVEKARMSAGEMQSMLRRIRAVDSIDHVKADLIIEAIVELLEPKAELLARLEKINPSAILASNTSTFPIHRIAASLQHPSRCVGLHFFNPATHMKLVEIIAGAQTAVEVVETMKELCVRLGKTAVVVSDSPGFIVNRVARPYYIESLRVLEEGKVNVDTIDRLLVASGFRLGPFALMDTIGVDVNLAVTKSMYEAFGRPSRFRPSAIQEELVTKGHWGRKKGKGFYEYPDKV